MRQNTNEIAVTKKFHKNKELQQNQLICPSCHKEMHTVMCEDYTGVSIKCL